MFRRVEGTYRAIDNSASAAQKGAMTQARDNYWTRFGGIGRLYGLSGLERLQASHVCVVGVGGVGSWVVEALARSGIGALTLIDLDDVCVTNINRQVHATDSTVGESKVLALQSRIHIINPECDVRPISEFFTETTAATLLDAPYDVVVDAIDQPRNKCRLIDGCRQRGIPMVTVGGAGGKSDPAQIRVADITRATNDTLLRRVRKMLRQEFGYPRGSRRWELPCVYSLEKSVFPTPDGEVCTTPDPQTSLRLDCASGFGTTSVVTGSFGFFAASAALKILTTDKGSDSEP